MYDCVCVLGTCVTEMWLVCWPEGCAATINSSGCPQLGTAYPEILVKPKQSSPWVAEAAGENLSQAKPTGR